MHFPGNFGFLLVLGMHPKPIRIGLILSTYRIWKTRNIDMDTLTLHIVLIVAMNPNWFLSQYHKRKLFKFINDILSDSNNTIICVFLYKVINEWTLLLYRKMCCQMSGMSSNVPRIRHRAVLDIQHHMVLHYICLVERVVLDSFDHYKSCLYISFHHHKRQYKLTR